MVFYYKIASLYFGIGEHQNCIDFLDKIISNKSLQMREDLVVFFTNFKFGCTLRGQFRLQFGVVD